MAAVTPSSTYVESVGSLKLTIANFANTSDSADTWASGIPGILSVMACQADASATQTSIGAGASFSGSTVTLYAAEDNSAITLHVYSKSG